MKKKNLPAAGAEAKQAENRKEAESRRKAENRREAENRRKAENRREAENRRARNRNALRGGSYSLLISAVVLAILIAVNVFASALPANLTQYDISSSQLYSITSNTKVVVNALEEDVTIYWIVQSGEEDDIIENLLSRYESLSDHIEVVKRNPDVYPTFAE